MAYKYLPFDRNRDETSIHLLFHAITIFGTATILSIGIVLYVIITYDSYVIRIVLPFDMSENVFLSFYK